MKNLSLDIRYNLLLENELSASDRTLVEQAKAATHTSYTPYSNFNVGAAASLANGSIVSGSNQENAAFPSGLCAERCALFYAHASHPDIAVSTLAIAARGRDGKYTEHPISPCGACRQVMAETEYRSKHPLRILLYGTQGIYEIKGVSNLLPFMFTDVDMQPKEE